MNKQEWLLNQIAQFPELSARELASYLNDKVLVDNPTPIGQVPVVPTLEEVSDKVTDTEVFEIGETEAYKRILDALNQNRPDWIVGNLTTLKRGLKLSQESYDAILVLLQRTELDPNYQEQILISPAELAGYGVILVSDVVMPNAVFSTSGFLGDGTQLTFINNLNSAMLTAGFTLLDSYTNTGLYRVWNFNTGGTQTYKDLILEFGFSNTSVRLHTQRIFKLGHIHKDRKQRKFFL
jgi:hypothetical protein